MQITTEKIAQIVGGRVLATAGSAQVTGISTDSRTLQSGDLFVPLKGPHYDGHAYLRQAVEHGAAACLSEEIVGGLPVPIIQVDDALLALGELAAFIRRKFSGVSFAITGTTGKTSTKEMLAAILGVAEAGLKTEGNYNNLIGLPLTLARLENHHRWMVLELGMSHPGEISRLTQIARPDVAVITNIGAGHLAGVGDIAGVARAKGELFAGLKAGAIAVINADDPLARQLAVPDGVRQIRFGLSAGADVRAVEIKNGKQARFTLLLDGGSYAVELPLPGRHQVSNALAAAAAAHGAGIGAEQIVAGLSVVKMAAARLEVRQLAGAVTLLDDSYNANPQSMAAALTALGDWPCQGRRIAVLADMLELGSAAEECHRELGMLAAQKVDVLVTLGQWADVVLQGAGEPPAILTHRGQNHQELGDWLASQLRCHDCVLVKGSRGMHMEKVIQRFTAKD